MVDIFSKYVMKDEDKSEVFHSSAYGQAQNGASMGSASTESFEARRSQDQNRQFIKGYNDSKVMGSAFSPAARPATVQPGDLPTSRVSNASRPGVTPTSSAMSARSAMPTRGAMLARSAAPARPAMSRPPMRQNPGIHR